MNIFQDLIKKFKSKYKYNKLYIVVKDTIPVGHALNCNAHVAIKANDTWKYNFAYQMWKKLSFKKVTCVVTEDEYNKLIQWADVIGLKHVEITESALDRMVVCSAFFPMNTNEPKFSSMKFLRLYK